MKRSVNFHSYAKYKFRLSFIFVILSRNFNGKPNKIVMSVYKGSLGHQQKAAICKLLTKYALWVISFKFYWKIYLLLSMYEFIQVLHTISNSVVNKMYL